MALILKTFLQSKDPSLSIFLDVDDLEDIHNLKLNVAATANVIVLVTEGVLERFFVIEEITTALALGKNVIVIWDRDRCEFPTSCAESITSILSMSSIVWSNEKGFRDVAIDQILTRMAKPNLSHKSWEKSEVKEGNLHNISCE